MRVYVLGGTGLVGRSLLPLLADRGHQAVVLTRNAEKARSSGRFDGVELVSGDPSRPGSWQRSLEGADAVVNLVGHGVFDDRWTPAIKQKIRESRVLSTRHLAQAIDGLDRPPSVLVQGSAIGYYGAHGDETVDESTPPGDDFLARVCVDWEAEAQPVQERGTRLAVVRIGVVLAPGGGALRMLTPLFRWVPGGAAPVGSGGSISPARGRQWFSWIHIRDLASLFLFAIDDHSAAGPLNGTAPEPVRNADFSRALARAVHRPFLPFGPPDAVLRVLLGEVAGTITTGQRVLPERPLHLGFVFRFASLESALADLFARG